MSSDFELFKAKQKNKEFAENYKMFVVILIIVSVIIFSTIGAMNVKGIIWYWAGFMGSLVAFAALLDYKAHKKNKKLEADWKKNNG